MWNIAQMLPSLCTAAPHLKKIGKERLWFTVDNRVQRPRDFFRWGAAVNRLMLPKVRKSASGCSKCKIVLQTQKSAQKVLSAIGKGLYACGADGRSLGRAVCGHVITKFLGWVDYHIFLLMVFRCALRFARESSANILPMRILRLTYFL